MDKEKLDAVLIPLTQEAYQAEMQGDWGKAYDIHDRAAQDWAAFAKAAKMFSTNDQICKQLAETRTKLHRERLGYLRPFAKDGKPVPDILSMHPSKELMLAGLSNLVTPMELSSIRHDPQKTLSMMLPRGQRGYTSTLPLGQPPTEYVIRSMLEGVNWKHIDHAVISLVDPRTNMSVLLLEGWARMQQRGEPNPGLQEVLIYRPADHPIPAFRIRPIQTTSIYVAWFPFLLRTDIFGLDQPVTINDTPDRPDRSISERRFAWGENTFVRKPLGKNMSYFSVHEYFNATPKPGSKTGKRDDDSLPQRLFWVDSNSFTMFSKEWKAFAAAGLDPLLREYLAATQLMELGIAKLGASQRPEPSASSEELAGLIVAKSIIVNILVAIIAL